MTALWYAMRSKPCKEDFLWKQLRAREIECFYPRARVRSVNPRARVARPYFPGYVFICADLEQVGLSALQWMPGGAGLVAFGGQPAWVPENLINAIRRRMGEIDAAGGEALAGLQHGDPVVIREGPFAGYQAIFDTRLSGEERARVLLSLLGGQQLSLELPASQIECKKQS
jgi:transcription antitermination factor NusG